MIFDKFIRTAKYRKKQTTAINYNENKNRINSYNMVNNSL